MIRLTGLWFVVAFVSVYAWRDWYRATCGLVLLMAVIEHPDMPKTLFGIQGLNPWNIAFASVVLAWLSARQREGLRWDMPSWLTGLLVGYLVVVVVSFVRMVADRGPLGDEATVLSLTSEYFINTLKWVVPGFILFDGCRSEERFKLGILSMLAVYVLLAVQVVRWMYPFAGLGGDELQRLALKILPKEVGYHRVNLSTMFAGASWAVIAARPLLPKGLPWTGVAYAAAAMIVAAQALTGGRTGYATWMALGLMLGAIRWRKHLLLVPGIVMLVMSFVPGVSERMMQGFTADSVDSNQLVHDTGTPADFEEGGADLYTVTSGRTTIWPFVIDLIAEAPFVGYGRQAMIRTGLTDDMARRFGESEAFGHPHNAYLEWLLDNGWVGMTIIGPFYVYLLVISISLFRDHRADYYGVSGGVAFSLIGALLIGAIGSQTFYPREGAVGTWCAIGLLLRVSLERKRILRQFAERPKEQPPASRRVASPRRGEPHVAALHRVRP